MRIRLSTWIVLIVCGSLLVWRHLPRWPAPDPDAANPAVLARLQQPTRLPMEDVPLTAALARLAQAQQLTMVIDPDVAAQRQPALQQHVGLPDRDLSAQSALQLLLRQADIHLVSVVQQGRVFVTTAEARDGSGRFFVGQVHAIPVGAVGENGIEAAHLCDVITHSFAPNEWEGVGGAGAIRALPGAVAVSHLPSVQQSIARLIDALVTVEQERTRTEPIRIDPQPSNAFAKARSQLETKVSLNIDDCSVDEIFEMLRKTYRLPLFYDRLGLDDLNVYAPDVLSRRLTFQVREVRLGTVLQWVLRQAGVVALDQHDVIFITHPRTLDSQSETVVYPVGDLLSRSVGMDDLIQVVIQVLRPDSWSDVGGGGDVESCGQALVITQSSDAHAELADFFRRLRQVLHSPTVVPHEAAESRNAALHERLDRRVSLAAHARPLDQVVGQLCEQHDVNLLIDDTDPFGEIGTWDDWTSPVSVQLVDQPLRDVLRRLLTPVGLTASPWEDVVVLASAKVAATAPTINFYNVESLLEATDRGRYRHWMGGELQDLIESLFEPGSWSAAGGEGEAALLGNALIIAQTEWVNADIRQLLDELMQAPDRPDSFGVYGGGHDQDVRRPTVSGHQRPPLLIRIYHLGSSAGSARPSPRDEAERRENGASFAEPLPTPFELEAVVQNQIASAQLQRSDGAAEPASDSWDMEGGDAVIKAFTVEDRPLLIVRQTAAGHVAVERLLRAICAARRHQAPVWQDEHGWQALVVSAADPTLVHGFVFRSVARELEMLTTLGATTSRNPYLSTQPANMLWQYVVHNLPDERIADRTYLWDGRIGVIVDDLEQADPARQRVQSLLAVLGEIAAAPGGDAAAHETAHQRMDRFLSGLLDRADPLRRQGVALLIRAHLQSVLPLTSAQVERLAEQDIEADDALMWQTCMELATACGPDAVRLVPAFDRVLPALKYQQRDQLIELLGTLGPDAVPLLCSIIPADDPQRSRQLKSLKLAAAGDPVAIRTVLLFLLGAIDIRFNEETMLIEIDVLNVLKEIDPELAVTRQVLQGELPTASPITVDRWQRFQRMIDTVAGDLRDAGDRQP